MPNSPGGQPLPTRRAYERAVAEAASFLEHPPAPGSPQERRFLDLLRCISEFRSFGEPPPGPLGGDLDRRLRTATGAHAEGQEPEPSHWRPLVGGDVRAADPNATRPSPPRRS